MRNTAAVYAPTAINAPWPKETWPEYPVNKIIEDIKLSDDDKSKLNEFSDLFSGIESIEEISEDKNEEEGLLS